jgi:hypothetical protein
MEDCCTASVFFLIDLGVSEECASNEVLLLRHEFQ